MLDRQTFRDLLLQLVQNAGVLQSHPLHVEIQSILGIDGILTNGTKIIRLYEVIPEYVRLRNDNQTRIAGDVMRRYIGGLYKDMKAQNAQKPFGLLGLLKATAAAQNQSNATPLANQSNTVSLANQSNSSQNQSSSSINRSNTNQNKRTISDRSPAISSVANQTNNSSSTTNTIKRNRNTYSSNTIRKKNSFTAPDVFPLADIQDQQLQIATNRQRQNDSSVLPTLSRLEPSVDLSQYTFNPRSLFGDPTRDNVLSRVQRRQTIPLINMRNVNVPTTTLQNLQKSRRINDDSINQSNANNSINPTGDQEVLIVSPPTTVKKLRTLGNTITLDNLKSAANTALDNGAVFLDTSLAVGQGVIDFAGGVKRKGSRVLQKSDKLIRDASDAFRDLTASRTIDEDDQNRDVVDFTQDDDESLEQIKKDCLNESGPVLYHWAHSDMANTAFYQVILSKNRPGTAGKIHYYALQSSTGTRMNKHDTTIREAYQELQNRMPFALKLALKAAGVPDANQYIDRISTQNGKVVVDTSTNAKIGSKMLTDAKEHFPEWKKSAYHNLIEFIEKGMDKFDTLDTNEKAANIKARIGLLQHLQDTKYNNEQLIKIAEYVKL